MDVFRLRVNSKSSTKDVSIVNNLGKLFESISLENFSDKEPRREITSQYQTKASLLTQSNETEICSNQDDKFRSRLLKFKEHSISQKDLIYEFDKILNFSRIFPSRMSSNFLYKKREKRWLSDHDEAKIDTSSLIQLKFKKVCIFT
jgi:hypothetical protein